MPYCHDAQISRVRLLSKSISDAANTTSLELLQAVEVTVDALCDLQRRMRDHPTKVINLTEEVRARGDTVLDRDGAIADLMEETEKALKLGVAILRAQMSSAYRDPALRGDNEDAVVSEYEAAIALLTDLHNAMVELRWAVLEHDADLEVPSDQVFQSHEALMKELKA